MVSFKQQISDTSDNKYSLQYCKHRENYANNAVNVTYIMPFMLGIAARCVNRSALVTSNVRQLLGRTNCTCSSMISLPLIRSLLSTLWQGTHEVYGILFNNPKPNCLKLVGEVSPIPSYLRVGDNHSVMRRLQFLFSHLLFSCYCLMSSIICLLGFPWCSSPCQHRTSCPVLPFRWCNSSRWFFFSV